MAGNQPTEITLNIISYLDLKSVASFIRTNKHIYAVSSSPTIWKGLYLENFGIELDAITKCKERVKEGGEDEVLYSLIFLESFVDEHNWKESLKKRWLYQKKLDHLCAHQEDFFESNDEVYDQYHSPIDDELPRMGFKFERNYLDPLFSEKVHASFLELTYDNFMSDEPFLWMSAIDPFHEIYKFHPHLRLAVQLKLLASNAPASDIDDKYLGHYITLDGDNVEWTIPYERQWGIYSNYNGDMIIWGQLLNLLETNYTITFEGMREEPSFHNFSNLKQ